MRHRARLRLLAASVTAIGSCSPQARAFDRFWNSFASGSFTDSTKWLGGAVPGSGDTAVFRVFGGTPGPYTVTFPGQFFVLGPVNYVNDQLRVGPNTVSFAQSANLNFGPSTYTLNTAIQIGEGTGPTVLNTSLSFLASPNASIGFLAGSPATLNVNAGAFNITGSGGGSELIVGDNSTGTLNIGAGATVNVTGVEGNAVIGANPGTGGTVNVVGAGALWNNNSGSAPLVIGGAGSGALNITAGGQVNNSVGYIGSEAGSSGSVIVDGAGSAWTNRGLLIVGRSGVGNLTVSGGGQVSANSANLGSSAGSTGTVQVSGAGSTWTQNLNLDVGGIVTFNGSSGAGVMLVSSGGQVVTGGDGSVGSAGSGTVSVDGVGSKWTIFGRTTIDDSGVAHISGGGRVVSNTAFDLGRVTIAGAGSGWDISDFLSVSSMSLGATSGGSISISDGGHVSNRVAFIGGGGLNGMGGIFLDSGSTWNSAEQLFIANSGLGDFTVARGAQLTSGAAQLGVVPNSLATAKVDGAGSTWNNPGSMYVGVAGTATLASSNGGLISVGGPFLIGPHGTLEGNSTIATPNVQNGGTVAPGVTSSIVQDDFLGTLHINGNYTQGAAGKLAIEIGSTSLFDRLQISGNAALDGFLQTTLVNGFVPVPGDRFTVLTSAARTGTFQPTASLGGGGFFLVPLYTPTDVIIFVAGGGEKTWGVDANGNSSIGANWFRGAPGAVDDRVAFSTVITAPRTVTVDTPFTAGSIYFDGVNSYLVQGPGAITLQTSTGNAFLGVKNVHGGGIHTIAAPMILNSSTRIDVVGGSALRIAEQMTVAPGASVFKSGNGRLEVKNIRADALAINAGVLAVMSKGGAEGTSIVKSLTIDPTGRLDLNANDLLVPYTGATVYPAIRTYLLNGLNTGLGGIISTAGLSDGRTIHAIVDNTHLHLTSWNGFTINDNTIIAKYTLRGDANLDGKVGFPDLVTLAQNYNNNTGLASWDIGDFNYDGNVGFADLVMLAQNYNGALPSEAIAGAPDGLEQDLATAFASVPEPASVAGLAFLAYALADRRRRGFPHAVSSPGGWHP
jgi:T5SS/PEP-CTERM-associated repeat protein